MWPFNLFGQPRKVHIKLRHERFATANLIRPEDIPMLAEQGYAAVICVRPDNEQPNQPTFEEIAGEARKRGMKAFYIPVSSVPTVDQAERFKKVMATIDGPVLGYCRSGTRAAILYSLLER